MAKMSPSLRTGPQRVLTLQRQPRAVQCYTLFTTAQAAFMTASGENLGHQPELDLKRSGQDDRPSAKDFRDPALQHNPLMSAMPLPEP